MDIASKASEVLEGIKNDPSLTSAEKEGKVERFSAAIFGSDPHGHYAQGLRLFLRMAQEGGWSRDTIKRQLELVVAGDAGAEMHDHCIALHNLPGVVGYTSPFWEEIKVLLSKRDWHARLRKLSKRKE